MARYTNEELFRLATELVKIGEAAFEPTELACFCGILFEVAVANMASQSDDAAVRAHLVPVITAARTFAYNALRFQKPTTPEYEPRG